MPLIYSFFCHKVRLGSGWIAANFVECVRKWIPVKGVCGVGTHSKRFLRKMIVWWPQLTCAISVHFLSSADLTQDVSVINSALATCFGFYCLRNMSVSLLLWNCQPKINANAVSHSFTSAMISGLFRFKCWELCGSFRCVCGVICKYDCI